MFNYVWVAADNFPGVFYVYVLCLVRHTSSTCLQPLQPL